MPEIDEDERGDACQRCGAVGQDRRTLWMSCFYAMDELDGIPFQGVQWDGITRPQTGTAPVEFLGRTFDAPLYGDPDSTLPHRMHFYTLRVCKACRAAWMSAIEQWFLEGLVAAHTEPDQAADIPIREHGATRMVTAAEYERLYPGWTPRCRTAKERPDA